MRLILPTLHKLVSLIWDITIITQCSYVNLGVCRDGQKDIKTCVVVNYKPVVIIRKNKCQDSGVMKCV